MPDTNDQIRKTLLSILLDPRCVALALAAGIVGYVIGRLGI